MSGYDRENRNVLRRCLKTASDSKWQIHSLATPTHRAPYSVRFPPWEHSYIHSARVQR